MAKVEVWTAAMTGTGCGGPATVGECRRGRWWLGLGVGLRGYEEIRIVLRTMKKQKNGEDEYYEKEGGGVGGGWGRGE